MQSPVDLRASPRTTLPRDIEELDRVRLTRKLVGPEGAFDEGSTGTIVHVHGAGVAYEVEITAPVHAVVTVEAADVERLND